MKSFIVLLAVAVLLVAAVECGKRKNGGQKRKEMGGESSRGFRRDSSEESVGSESRSRSFSRGGRRGGRGGRGGRGKPSMSFGLIPCRLEDSAGAVINESRCPGNLQCLEPTSGFSISQGSAGYKVFFCNSTFPNPSMACRFENASGTPLPYRKTIKCDVNVTCSAGPIAMPSSSVQYYVCGDQVPTTPNFTRALTRRACEIGGTAQKECKRQEQTCSLELTVGSVTAKYCSASASEPLSLNVFGRCGGKRRGGRKSSESQSAESDEDQESVTQTVIVSN